MELLASETRVYKENSAFGRRMESSFWSFVKLVSLVRRGVHIRLLGCNFWFCSREKSYPEEGKES